MILRFTRARLRGMMPELAREGLDARGLARLAARVRRAEAAIEFVVGAARAALAPGAWPERGPITFATAQFADLPAEVALRLLGRAMAHTGNEGPVELAKLEALYEALAAGPFSAAADAGRGSRSRSTKTGSPSNAPRPGGTAPAAQRAPQTRLKGRFTN